MKHFYFLLLVQNTIVKEKFIIVFHGQSMSHVLAKTDFQ